MFDLLKYETQHITIKIISRLILEKCVKQDKRKIKTQCKYVKFC